MIPDWANTVFVNKGLGFESADFKMFVFDFFNEQFQSMDLTPKELHAYFVVFLDSEIKKGNIDKAIKHFKQQPKPVVEAKPVRQSALAEFEDKYRDYL